MHADKAGWSPKGRPPAAGPIAFILKGYPRLSETFIAQEIAGLERAGFDIRIYSLRPPREAARHPVHAQIGAPVAYLPERLRDAPLRVLKAAARQLANPRLARTLAAWAADFARGPSLDRVRRLGQALVLAAELPADTARLHAHFLHTPAQVAHYAALLRALPWSASAHARDIWTLADWEKRRRLGALAWLVTCTEAGRAHLARLAPAPGQVHLVYHGLDLAALPPPPDRPPRRGAEAGAPVRILSVGRAVEKKGFDTLLEALARLPDGLHWHFTHVGSGDKSAALAEQARTLAIAGRITWRGALTRDEVVACYEQADLFALPCRIAADGDRDGLPNVLLEAQAMGLACISTPVSGVPELIEDGVNGLLVPPDDADALAAAIAILARDPERRAAMGAQGRRRVRERFSFDAGLVRLASLLAQPVGARIGTQAEAARQRSAS